MCDAQRSAGTDRLMSNQLPSSLRAMVSAWFDATSRARVTHFGRIYPGGSRYVCVSAPRRGGAFAYYFFHHGTGDWRLYPPRGIGPSIAYWSIGVTQPAAKANSG
jgi:hypothetical protein